MQENLHKNDELQGNSKNSVPKKMLALCILKILEENSNKSHPLMQKQIADLIKNTYNMTVQRKAIGSSIAELQKLEYPIKNTPKKGWYISKSSDNQIETRLFSQSEATFLIDLIYSLKGITAKQADNFIEKIRSTLPENERIIYKDYIQDTNKIKRSYNSYLFDNINKICNAILKKKQISFQTITYVCDNESNLKIDIKNNGENYSPHALLFNNGLYYLICYSEKLQKEINIRMDEICKVNITRKDSTPEPSEFGEGFDDSTFINSHPTFSTEQTEHYTLKFDKSMLSVVFEYFGFVKIRRYHNEFIARVKTDKPTIIDFCIQYGKNVELIRKPDQVNLRREIKATLKNILNKYQ